MSIKITTPLSTVCDVDGNPMKGVAKCASDLEIAEKLARLPKGTYLIVRPPVKVVVK